MLLNFLSSFLLQFQVNIFVALYPILKSKTVRIGAAISESILKGWMKIQGYGEYSEYFSKGNIEGKDFINFDDLVICFDDLERISASFELKEFIGFVNSLVENQNVKIILIANESKIDDHEYSDLKEKTVANSIEFSLDVQQAFDGIIKEKYASYKIYSKFLEAEKQTLLDIFLRGSTNLRILSFALTYFHQIHSEITNNIHTDPALESKKEGILKMLLRFSIAISIAYRTNKVSLKNKNGLDWNENNNWEIFNLELFLEEQNNPKENSGEREKTYLQEFRELFYSNDTFYFFPSIYNFITGGQVIKVEMLFEELRKVYHIENKVVLPQYEILNKLGMHQYRFLTDEEYKAYVNEMLVYVDKGDFELKDYLTIFYFASRFKNPIGFNLGNLERRILSGMLKGKSKYRYEPALSRYLTLPSNPENSKHLNKIKNAMEELNEEIRRCEQKKETQRITSLCYNDFNKFSEEMLSNEFISEPIFQSFSATEFYNCFQNSSNANKVKMINFISARYKNRVSYMYIDEQNFFSQFLAKVEKKCNSKQTKGVSFSLWEELKKMLYYINKEFAQINQFAGVDKD